MCIYIHKIFISISIYISVGMRHSHTVTGRRGLGKLGESFLGGLEEAIRIRHVEAMVVVLTWRVGGGNASEWVISKFQTKAGERGLGPGLRLFDPMS